MWAILERPSCLYSNWALSYRNMANQQLVYQSHIPLKWKLGGEKLSYFKDGIEGKSHTFGDVSYLHAFINLKVPSNRSGVVRFLLVKNEIAMARYMEMRCRGGIVPQ